MIPAHHRSDSQESAGQHSIPNSAPNSQSRPPHSAPVQPSPRQHEATGAQPTPQQPDAACAQRCAASTAAEPAFQPKGFRRHIIQLLAALLYNLNFAGFANGTIYQGPTKALCVPGLNCYSCPGAIGACPIGSLSSALAASNKALPLYVIGTLLAFGALLGRTICGWFCPFGLLQDLIDKVPTPKLQKGTWSRNLSWAKYGILAVFVIALPVILLLATGSGIPAFCAYLCPAGTLEAGLPLLATNPDLQMMIGALFDWKVAVLIAFITACLFIYRPFCRFMCPLGAIYSFFNRFALLRWTVDEHRCTHCGTCIDVCKMDVCQVSDRECIQCGLCAQACPEQAIRFSVSARRSETGNIDSPDQA